MGSGASTHVKEITLNQQQLDEQPRCESFSFRSQGTSKAITQIQKYIGISLACFIYKINNSDVDHDPIPAALHCGPSVNGFGEGSVKQFTLLGIVSSVLII